MSCVVDSHIDIQNINEWLHADVGYGRINELLLQRGHDQIPSSTMGRHRERCLGLEPKKLVRGEVAPKELKAPPPTLPLPSEEELVNEAKRVLFWRLKTQPAKVPTTVLASILAASMREKKPDKPNTFEEILEQIGQDEQTPAPGEGVEEVDNSGPDGI